MMKEMMLNALSDGLRILRVVAIVGIPVAILLFHVWNRYQITDLGYEVAAETRTHRQLIEEQRKLSIELTYQGRSDRVQSVAREQFGLEELRPDQVLQLDDFGELEEAEVSTSSGEELEKHAALQVKRSR